MKYSNNKILRDKKGRFIGLCHCCRPDKHKPADHCPLCPACYDALRRD